MPRLARPLLPAVALVLAACGGGARGADTASAAAPAVDLAKEEQAIRAIDARMLEAVQRRDTAAIAGFYAASGLWLAPGSPPLRGAEGARRGWGALFGASGASVYFSPTLVNVAEGGDMAYEVGTYSVTGGRDGGRGKYLVVWKKYEGQWKIVADARSADGAGK